MSMEDWKITALDYLLLMIIILLAGMVLLMNYAAQKDMQSLNKAYGECKQAIVYANEGKLTMFQNTSIKGDLIETNTSIKR